MNEDKALVMLRLRCERHTRKGRNQGDLAREIGVSDAYMSMMLRGEKPLSQRALDYLGLKRERFTKIVRKK